MRPWSLILVVFACLGCTVRLPARAGVTVAVRGSLRADARVTAPPVPQPAVALQGAPVVEFFGIPLDDAQDVVFVLDCSGSMNNLAQGPLAQVSTPGQPAGTVPTKIAVAREELADALARLPPGTRLNAIFFNGELEVLTPGLTPLDDGERDGLIAFVRETQATGPTALAPAMRAAFMMNARRVVLLSDGLGNVGGDSGDVLRDAREAMHGGVRIDTVGLGAGQDAALLGALASESGGLYQAL